MGGKAGRISYEDPKISGLQVQKSSYGLVIPVGWGTNRVAPNLGWFGGFQAIPHTETTTSGGKGGAGGKVTQTTTTYTYQAAILMFVGEGPINTVRTVYRDKSIFVTGGTTALAQAGLSLAVGNVGQSPWGYLTTNYPSQALGYSELAYVYAPAYALNSGAAIPNHSFEVDFQLKVSGKDDAAPKDIVTDFLQNTRYGVPQWSSALTGDLTEFHQYTMANNLLLSPVLDQQRTARDVLAEWMIATNSNYFWSEGLLKIRPYGDAAATGNGQTFTPNLTPIYDLDEEAFNAEDDEDPVVYSSKSPGDLKNKVFIEYLDRAKQYDIAVMPANDLGSIDEFGPLPEATQVLHCICDAVIAKQVAQLRLQRVQYIDGVYTFSLPWAYIRLEPMDLVTLTTTSCGGLNRQLVRILKVKEDEAGLLSFEAEPVNTGTASAALYGSGSTYGVIRNFSLAPGNVSAPYIFAPPASLSGGALEMWCAVAGDPATWGGAEVWVSLDTVNYKKVGVITGPARYGVTTTSLAAAADPDITHTVGVNLATSWGDMIGASQPEVDAELTPCILGGEVIDYRDATLTSANHYTLGYLRRGRHGTTPGAHLSGVAFARLDDAIFKVPFEQGAFAETMTIKFRSYNIYGEGLQDLAACTAYTALTDTNIPAPAAGSWNAIGSSITNGTGGSQPVILVTGSVPSSIAIDSVLLEYRRGTTADWIDGGEAGPAITGRNIPGVADNATDYYVAVSFKFGGKTGARLVLGPVTTGSLAIPGGPATDGNIVLDTSAPGSWSATAPNTGFVEIEAWGPGGNGGAPYSVTSPGGKDGGGETTTYFDGGGGGGGGYSYKHIACTVGDTYGGTIGAPGTATTVTSPAITANTGTAGSASGGGTANGAGGTATGGTTNTTGRAGGLSSSTSGGGAGNGGGDSTSGAGTTPGGGGSGSYNPGANGRIKITFRTT